MAFPKEFRQQLGLSLAEFASLLNISLGQLSMIESGLRSLTPAALTIAQLLITKAKNIQQQAVITEEFSLKETTLLDSLIRKGLLKTNKLQQKQIKLIEKLNAADYLLQVAQQFGEQDAITENEELGIQVAILKRKAIKNVERYKLLLINLQWQLAGLANSIEKAQYLRTTKIFTNA